MSLTKKVTVSALAVSMLSASLGVVPLSQKGLIEKFGVVHRAYAANAGLPSPAFLQRMNEVHAALVAGDAADVQNVRNLRDEIARLDDQTDQYLLDPIWNKISGKLPESVDQAELKESLFRLVKAVGSFRYDPKASDLEAIRTNPEFRATLQTIAAAGGHDNLKMDDFLVFLFGDGDKLKGLEGTIVDVLKSKPPLELARLFVDRQGIHAVLTEAADKLLRQTDDYTFSSILNNLDVTATDVRATVLGFQMKLDHAVPATHAMAIAYIRSAAKADVEISDDGRMHRYSLNVFGIKVPNMVLNWVKVSGSPDVTVEPDGVVSIPEDVPSASAVIRAMLISPSGGTHKVIFEQEVTLTAEQSGDVFPVKPFLERMNKIRAALLAGDPADILDVRKARDEIAGLNAVEDQKLIDPLWNRISPHLPDSVDRAELKTKLFNMLQALGSFRYDPQASDLEAIRNNPEYREALKTIAAAGGVNSLTMDDFLIFLFGDAKDRIGFEGTVLRTVADMKSKEIAALLGNQDKMNAVFGKAMTELLSKKQDYALTQTLRNLGVKPADLMSTVENFQNKLKYDLPAMNAIAVAYVRAEAKSTVKITANGRHHEYQLSFMDIRIPSSILQWTKVSGDKDVEVKKDGKVSISNKVAQGTAVIQAALINPYGGPAKVVFQQEVTLVNGSKKEKDDPKDEVRDIIKELEEKLDELKEELLASTGDLQKVKVLLEVVQTGKDTVNRIQETDAPKAVKHEALRDVKNQVNQTVFFIIEHMMGV
ncbi:hypothetical protein E5161_06070 [Cohnella pontilimi]|uniref:SbsC C-terminal domain-containing protein n=1 Tax=Cohnella pontilimi TaxID=2564100 RepID=A0A4U0FF20_9BACL|nr:hypothetical protein [Cohnella pontilimi]TJY43447.1 hypothetical protein E5161_06070 [Cohnella pontilimi]